MILIASVFTAQCSATYKMKSDMTKNGVIDKTPWYVKYPIQLRSPLRCAPLPTWS